MKCMQLVLFLYDLVAVDFTHQDKSSQFEKVSDVYYNNSVVKLPSTFICMSIKYGPFQYCIKIFNSVFP